MDPLNEINYFEDIVPRPKDLGLMVDNPPGAPIKTVPTEPTPGGLPEGWREFVTYQGETTPPGTQTQTGTTPTGSLITGGAPAAVPSTSTGIPTWAWVLGGGVLLYMMLKGR